MDNVSLLNYFIKIFDCWRRYFAEIHNINFYIDITIFSFSVYRYEHVHVIMTDIPPFVTCIVHTFITLECRTLRSVCQQLLRNPSRLFKTCFQIHVFA